MTNKATFTLDPQTTEAIKSLALNWNVSQAEVVRRSVQIAMNEVIEEKKRSPLAILESLEQKANSTKKEILVFKKTVKDNRKGWDK